MFGEYRKPITCSRNTESMSQLAASSKEWQEAYAFGTSLMSAAALRYLEPRFLSRRSDPSDGLKEIVTFGWSLQAKFCTQNGRYLRQSIGNSSLAFLCFNTGAAWNAVSSIIALSLVISMMIRDDPSPHPPRSDRRNVRASILGALLEIPYYPTATTSKPTIMVISQLLTGINFGPTTTSSNHHSLNYVRIRTHLTWFKNFLENLGPGAVFRLPHNVFTQLQHVAVPSAKLASLLVEPLLPTGAPTFPRRRKRSKRARPRWPVAPSQPGPHVPPVSTPSSRLQSISRLPYPVQAIAVQQPENFDTCMMLQSDDDTSSPTLASFPLGTSFISDDESHVPTASPPSPLPSECYESPRSMQPLDSATLEWWESLSAPATPLSLASPAGW